MSNKQDSLSFTYKTMILERLQGESMQELVHLGTNYLLQQPIHQLIDQQFIVGQVTSTLTKMIEGDETERWLRTMLESVDYPEGKARDYISVEMLQPLQMLLAQEITIQESIMASLFQHQLIENLFRQVVSQSIEGFTEKLKSLASTATNSAPDSVSKGLSALKGLRDRALKQTPLGGFASILETQASRIIREYVDKTIQATLLQAAEQLSHPNNHQEHASYRLHVLDVVLDTDIVVFQKTIDEIGIDNLVASLRAIIQGLLARDDFEEGLRTIIGEVFVIVGEKSIQQLADETGMTHDWRSDTEAQMTKVAQEFVQDPKFEQWLDSLLHREE